MKYIFWWILDNAPWVRVDGNGTIGKPAERSEVLALLANATESEACLTLKVAGNPRTPGRQEGAETSLACVRFSCGARYFKVTPTTAAFTREGCATFHWPSKAGRGPVGFDLHRFLCLACGQLCDAGRCISVSPAAFKEYHLTYHEVGPWLLVPHPSHFLTLCGLLRGPAQKFPSSAPPLEAPLCWRSVFSNAQKQLRILGRAHAEIACHLCSITRCCRIAHLAIGIKSTDAFHRAAHRHGGRGGPPPAVLVPEERGNGRVVFFPPPPAPRRREGTRSGVSSPCPTCRSSKRRRSSLTSSSG